MNIILYPPNNPVACNLFNLQIHWYGIIFALSILTGILLSYFLIKNKYSKKYCDIFLDSIPIIIIISIIGARLFYVIGEWEFYSKNLSETIMINHGGLSLFGAIFFGLVSIYICSKKYKFSFVNYCDILAVTMPLCQSIGRWGNFINQEAYGLPSNGIFKMYISHTHRYPQYSNIEFYHPAFLYESILDFILFIILITVSNKCKNIKSGIILCVYLISYSIIRLILECIRIDSILNISNIHIATLLSIFIILISSFALYHIIRR